jgi:hypothetical protein
VSIKIHKAARDRPGGRDRTTEQLRAFQGYLEMQFAREPYKFSPTIDTLVHEIDFVKTKEDNGDLRWRLDAALQLMGESHGI